MRLLSLVDGSHLMSENFGNKCPPYAILSHTWTEDEVTFQDILTNQGKEKHGYRKVLFCGQQALRDGIKYFWVDTCCIDRASSSELSEAVNSMFRWYQNAQVCYVYLEDVLDGLDGPDEWSRSTWQDDFRRCRWLTRSWTLQELIAPKAVELFSRDWHRLGDKRSLEQMIHEITGLPTRALQGHPLSEFSIEERLTWSQNRTTLRAEDRAYSLLGMFGVNMPLLYGEGEERAFRRLRREMRNQYRGDLAKDSDRPKDRIDYLYSFPMEGLQRTIGAESEKSELDDVESMFSDSGLSMSSKSSVELNPVRVSGIREITRVLLNSEKFKSVCTTAITEVAPEKSRAHIRGFLKNYGEELDKEARTPLQHQAARFVRELAGRIADELRWSITGFEETKKQEATGEEKPNLEKWLSTIEHDGNDDEKPLPVEDDGSDGNDSEDDPDTDATFPNIDAVADFILSSNAFGTLLQALDNWTKVKKHPRLIAKQVADPVLQSGRKIYPSDAVSPDSLLHADNLAPAASDKAKKSTLSDSGIEPNTRPANIQESIQPLIWGLLDFWGVSFFAHDILELFVPPVPAGFERVRWRCSCNTILWGDFPFDDSNALAELKKDLLMNLPLTANDSKADFTKSGSTQQHSSLSGEQDSPSHRRADRPDTTAQISLTRDSAADSSFNGRQSGDRQSLGLGLRAPSDISEIHLASLTDVTIDKDDLIYFEVCTNVGNSAVGHFELDITQTATDGDLFAKIWKVYNHSRGLGLRRFFLRPCDVHFVLFSVSARQASRYSAGIHKKPKEYPPNAELQERRYHYHTPKLIMPPHVFIHFLHRARWNVWGDHADDIWLKRLPKKLNESMLAAQATETTPDLVFGWGIHILDGPNHAVLGWFLSFGLLLTFVVSCLIMGIAKTQEQAFGVGQYLIAIMVAFMSAVYFKLQDQ